MKKLLLGLLILNASLAFSQTPDLDKVIDSFDKKLADFSKNALGNGDSIMMFIHTKDDKFIRIHSVIPNGRGEVLNEKFSKDLLTKGLYEGENVFIPELGYTCKKLTYRYNSANNLGVGYIQGCEKKN